MDMWEFFRQLQSTLHEAEFLFLASGAAQADVLLVLNACQVACAAVPPFSGRVIVVTPLEVDYWPVPQEHLLREVIRKLAVV